MAHIVLDCLDHGVAQGLTSDAVLDGFLRRLALLCEDYPRLWNTLRADLADAGRQVLMPASGDEAVWADFFLFSDMLRQSGLFAWLERTGVDQLRQEDREKSNHFSSYPEASFTMSSRSPRAPALDLSKTIPPYPDAVG